MVRRIDWTEHIGHRLKLRDLHVFRAVVQHGSMSKAAVQLGVSHPSVSEVIAYLEHAFRVQLFDRGPRGVQPTVFGIALLNRCNNAFDELKLSIRDIEYLKDAAGGQLFIGCAESLSASILPSILDQFSRKYPRVKLHVDTVVTGTPEVSRLRDRSLDLVLARMRPVEELKFAEDLMIEVLFDEKLEIVVGADNPLARRRKIDLSDLVNEPWLLTGPDNWNFVMVAESFRARGLEMPNVVLETLSIHLRTHLIANGRFITALPRSVLQLYARPLSLKILPVKLRARPWLVAIVTLKHRGLTPIAERFIECTREFAKQL